MSENTKLLLLSIQQTLDENSEALKQLNDKNVNFNINTKPIKEIFNNHLNNTEKLYEEILNKLNKTVIENSIDLTNKISEHTAKMDSLKFKVVPKKTNKYDFVILSIFFVFTLFSLFYSNYSLLQVENKEKEAYNKGIENVKEHIHAFFRENPKAKKAYNKWNKK